MNGRPVRPGVYELRLRAFDRAGNRSRRTRAVPVRVRYVELSARPHRGRRGHALRGPRVAPTPTRTGGSSPASGASARDEAPRPARAGDTGDVHRLRRRRPLRGQGGGRRHGAGRRLTVPPLFVLGVSRSGTTMLRVILDRSPGIAIPDETFFIPQLAHRHPARSTRPSSSRTSAGFRGSPPGGSRRGRLAARLRPGMTTGEALDAIFSAYAAKHGKPRWGDKTPMYMRHLGLIERLFPDAQYVHLDPRRPRRRARLPRHARRGRHAHLGAPAQRGGVRVRVADRGPARARARTARRPVPLPRGPVRGPRRRHRGRRALDLRVRRLPFEPAMLEFAGAVDVSAKPHHQRLLQPPTRGRPRWRHADERRWTSGVRGDRGRPPVRARLRAADGRSRADARARRRRSAWYRARMGAWNAAAYAAQRSPLWRRRHAPLF